MDRMVYVAMGGAKQILREQTLVANNLANANTNGFRADLASFVTNPVTGPGYASRVDAVAAGLGFDHSSGTLIDTGRDLDVAVDGRGWIAVQAADGSEAYTRGGELTIDALGLLRTRQGELVLGDNGPVSIPSYVQLAIGHDGTISIVPQGQGPETMAQVARIKLVNPEPAELQKRLDGLVEIAGGGAAQSDASVKVVSGMLESSNVELGADMVSMIELARHFELDVRMMRIADENASRAAELARL
jgi:flagellar basal-body rod protein FlgF